MACLMPGIVLLSLSARRAWIEINMLLRDSTGRSVALRKESVDRNFDIRYTTSTRPRSLSARRAWIEIHVVLVVPRGCWRRSPQGERG